ncbi:MAG: hypothetical protein AAFZ58_13735 [Pseudomonadota bacterium]
MQAFWTLPISLLFGSLLACSAVSPTALAASPKLVQSFNDTTFELNHCEIKEDRTAVCKMTVRNLYTDKGIEVTRNGITIQDNFGNDYPVTAGGFGDPSTASKWTQIAIADSEYTVWVVAPNLSSRATSVRAVVFPRLLLRNMQRQKLGFRDKVVFSGPPMLDRTAKPAPVAAVEADRPVSPTLGDAPPKPTAPSTVTNNDDMPIATDEWQVVGLWNYDGEDGKHVPAHGFVMHTKVGGALGQAWLAHLSLRNHDQLTARDRVLFPVMIHVAQRKVCADYPGYPTYPAFIDMPGEGNDAVFMVSACKPD